MNSVASILHQTIPLFVLVPATAFLLTLLWKNKNEKPIGLIVRITKVLVILMALAFFAGWLYTGREVISSTGITLYQTDHFVFAVRFFYDEITAVFSVVGALLFFLVATFAKYYMHRDAGYKRFFNIILLFAAGYNFIIFSGNFETLFVGWEIKGLCSFLLIAFYRERYLPVKNAFKAVTYYRISDVSLMVMMWMMHHLTHQNISFQQLESTRELTTIAGNTAPVFVIAFLMILPAAVKSAQLPFTAWLPRAMEGPTTSSAIFYGSLSVHIGVFFLLRTHPFWQDLAWVKIVIIVLGAATAVVATLTARVQPTVKTQIAYSSAAQIGLMFIEIALGFHWLVLIHFAGNAFLRTYQLLVSPSVLNYLVHHQYFHYTAPQPKKVSSFRAALYMLNVKEWNLDTFMFRYIWSPFKWMGKQFRFLSAPVYAAVLGVLAAGSLLLALFTDKTSGTIQENLPAVLLLLALVVILFAFSTRDSALRAWQYIITGHGFIMAALLLNAGHVNSTEVLLYASGVTAAFVLGWYCLRKTKSLDNDISLNRFHGYVYEQETTGLLFLIAAIGMLGFPVTAAFVGIDLFFTYIRGDQYVLITLLALCFVFIELSAFRILLRIYLGPHKKLNHPVAFRSS